MQRNSRTLQCITFLALAFMEQRREQKGTYVPETNIIPFTSTEGVRFLIIGYSCIKLNKLVC